MPARQYGSQYRFGYNGQEKDDEVAGVGNINTAMFWEYEVRLGRRWNRDIITTAAESPYATFKNNPILFNDVNGDCVDCTHKTKKGDTYSSLAKKYDVTVQELRGWNKYEDTKIPVGVDLIISDPNVIGVSEHKPGVGPDMASAHMTDIEAANVIGGGTNYDLQRRQNWSEGQLETEMKELGDAWASSDKDRAMVSRVFNHFLNGKGEAFIDGYLTDKALNHGSTQKFIHRDLIPKFDLLVKRNHGYRSGDPSFNLDIYGGPRFNETDWWIFGGDNNTGLKITINDIWAYRIKVVNYTEVENQYHAVVALTLYDHFGLDSKDFTEHTFAPIYPGFYSWFILQYQKGRHPFVTTMPMLINISGTK